MNKEDKSLLLQDLCGRLPYDVKVAFQVGNNIPDIRIFTGKDYDYLKYYHFIDEFTNCTFKPYLRPMSSMTKEERKEYQDIEETCQASFYPSYCHKLVDWLNAYHFDYRGLIEKGLAIETPEGMYEK